MSKISEMINELTKAYNAINEKYYNNELPEEIALTIQAKKATSYGHFAKESWANQNEDDDERFHEINVNPEHFTRPLINLLCTLNHEMVHLYCCINNIDDTSNGCVYHNKYFKQEAEKRGLIIDKAPTIGWSVTSPNEDFIEFVENLDIDKSIFDFYRVQRYSAKVKAPKRAYICPECGMEVNGKKNLHVMCGECNLDMEYCID